MIKNNRENLGEGFIDMTRTTVIISIVAASILTMAAAQADVSDQDLARAASGEWLHANGDWDGTRYSTVARINTSNVANLKVKWIYSIGGEKDTQATPLYHDGLLFLPQDNSVHAIDAAMRSGPIS